MHHTFQDTTEIINKTTVPKETNRQIGPLFKKWVESGILGVPVTHDVQEFLEYSGNIVLNTTDQAMKQFAEEYLGYQHNKGLDFVGKFNETMIIGEAKFLTDFGGHQNAQFNDAVGTMKAKLKPSRFKVKTIAILDGVLYIKGRHKMFTEISSFSNEEIAVSAVLLRDFLFSV